MSDPDSMDFVTGKLIVRTINGATGDLLGIRPQTLSNGDIISVSGSIVSYNGVPVFDSFTGGTENAPFVIRFTNPTSRSAIEALLQSVEFSAPAGSVIGVRFVAFELTDNAGGTSSRVAQQVTVDDLNNPATNPLIHPLL